MLLDNISCEKFILNEILGNCEILQLPIFNWRLYYNFSTNPSVETHNSSLQKEIAGQARNDGKI